MKKTFAILLTLLLCAQGRAFAIGGSGPGGGGGGGGGTTCVDPATAPGELYVSNTPNCALATNPFTVTGQIPVWDETNGTFDPTSPVTTRYFSPNIFGIPQGSKAVGGESAGGVWNFPASLAGIQVTCGTNPSESDAYLLHLNAVLECTLTLSTGCAVTVTTCGAGWATTAGQRLELDSPATVSGADIFWTIPFTTNP